MAKALSLQHALVLGRNLNFQATIFESDNLKLIKACRGNQIIGEIQAITEDIKSLSMSFSKCRFTWTKREGNSTAHSIADLAQRNRLNGNWTLNPPPELRSGLIKDRSSIAP